MKWHGILGGAITVAVLLTLFACGSKADLSRGKAKNVIEKLEKFTPAEYRVHIQRQGVQVGLHEGVWMKRQGTMDIWGGCQLELTAKGKGYFRDSEDLGVGGLWEQANAAYVTLKPLPRAVVEVTGIADASGMLGPPGTVKNVEFTWKWNWDEVADEVKRVLLTEPKEQKGEAVLRLYDDGWRVEELKLD